MDEFNSARLTAQKMNDIFHALYKNVHTNYFDADVDFSKISSSTLKDFLLYTAGFIGVKNKDEIDEILSVTEITKMLAGKFTIKYLTDEQLEVIAKKNGITIKDTDEPQTIKLYKIQDGTYYLNKNVFDPTLKEYVNSISLVTSPVEIQTDTPRFYRDPKEVLIILRNTFAHESPHVNGNKIYFSNFANSEDVISVSKMWLRGYTEMFARKSMPFTADQMADALRSSIRGTSNTLSNKEEINLALNSIKYMFSERQQEKFRTYKHLLNDRLTLIPAFQKKDLESKIETITGITCNNPSLFESIRGSSSPQILYTLENLIGMELEKRNEHAPLADADPDVMAFAKIVDELCAVRQGMKTISSLKSAQSTKSKAQKKYADREKFLTKKANAKIQAINPKRKLESAHMDLLAFENLENLPVEVAVNIIYLMAFNNLVSSRFYEQVLRYSDFKELNPTQTEFFENFNFGRIGFVEKKSSRKHTSNSLDAQDKAFLLYSMRNALCHGNLTYLSPNPEDGFDQSYKSVILQFNAEQQGVVVYGRLKDFYNLFSSPQFTQERGSDLITTYDPNRIKGATIKRKQKNKGKPNAEPNQN